MKQNFRTSARAALAVSAASLVAGAIACSSTSSSGELVIAIDTNVELPKNVDNIELQVDEPTAGQTHDFKFAYPQETATALGLPYGQLPGPVGVIAGASAGATLTVTLYGRKGETIVFQRVLTTIVPSSGTALLRLLIDGLCLGATNVSTIETACNGQTCIAGGCASELIDPSTLPQFSSTSAYTGTDAGACFSLASCFQQAPAGSTGLVPVSLNAASVCTIPVPITSNGVIDDKLLNIGVPVPSSLCTQMPCVVPLDSVALGESPLQGWTRLDAATIQVPQGLCIPVVGSPVANVLVSTACEAKTVDNPLCGDWDRVTSPEPSANGGELVSTIDGGVILSDGSTAIASDSGTLVSGSDGSTGDVQSSDGGQMDNDGSVGVGGDSGVDSGIDGGIDLLDSGSDGGSDGGAGEDGSTLPDSGEPDSGINSDSGVNKG